MFSMEERRNERMNDYGNEISLRTYNTILGLTVFLGLALNFLMVQTCYEFVASINPLVLFIGYFVSVLIGTFMSRLSKNPAISFFGYLLIAVPIGLLLAVALPGESLSDILLAIALTGVVVVSMIGLSILYPEFFATLGKTLLITLLIVFVVELVSVLVFHYNGVIFDYIMVGIFSLYIGFDWYRAQIFPKTVDNAIDCAIDIYLDIINLFLRILSILSKRRD